MELNLAGRRAVVTGAGSGIGAATVRALAKHGADVAFCDVDRGSMDKLAVELTDVREHLHPFHADMADRGSVEAFCHGADAAMGGCDILVNNVGVSPIHDFLDIDDEAWEMLFRLNLLSAVRCTRHFLPGMRERRGGQVVMMGSTLAQYPTASQIDYAAVKAALIATGKALGRKYASDHIRVNTVLPGRIRTGLWDRAAQGHGGVDARALVTARSADIPLGRFGEPEEVANVVLFLVSELASYVTASTITVDGGLSTHV